jgi:PKD repeat protein
MKERRSHSTRRQLISRVIFFSLLWTACQNSDPADNGPLAGDAGTVSTDAQTTSRDGQIAVGDSATDTGLVLTTPAAASPLQPADSTLGAQKGLFLLVNNSGGSEPCTKAEASAMVTDVEAWFEEVSYGRFTVDFTLLDWVNNVPAGSKSAAIKGYLADLAEGGMDLKPYKRVLAVFTADYGVPSESMSGLQSFEIKTTTGTYSLEASISWVNGFDCSEKRHDYILGTAVHESGHGLGLKHNRFINVATGHDDGHGNVADVMGHNAHSFGHYNAGFKDLLGWLQGDEVGLVTTSGFYALNAIESQPVGALRIPVQSGEKDYYYVESKQAKGADTDLAYNAHAGPLLHRLVWVDSHNGYSAYGLDATPETPSDLSNDFALMPGRTYSNTDAGIHITALETNSEGAIVHVELGNDASNQAPTVGAISATAEGDTNAYRFTVTPTDPDGDPIYVFWDFEIKPGQFYKAGTFASGTDVVHTFPNAEPRRIYAIVSDGRGGESWAWVDLFGYTNTAPVVNSVDVQPKSMRTFQFKADVEDEEFLVWHWDFGDGNTSKMAQPTHFYQTPGDYLVTVKVSDREFETVATTSSIDATAEGNIPPVADAGTDQTVSAGGTGKLYGTASYDPDAYPGPLRFTWQAPAGFIVQDTTSQRPTFTAPSQAGVYTVTLTVSDGEATNSDSVAITVQ